MKRLMLIITILIMFTGISFADETVLTERDVYAAPAIEKMLGQIQRTDFTFFVGSETGGTLAAETSNLTFRMPYACTLLGVRANVDSAPSADMVIDINDGDGTTIFNSWTNAIGSTIPAVKLYIQSGSETSLDAYTSTAATGSTYYMTTTSFDDDEEITVDIDSTTGGAGLTLTFYCRIKTIPTNY